jgi:hypothetical protein
MQKAKRRGEYWVVRAVEANDAEDEQAADDAQRIKKALGKWWQT